MLEKLIIDLWNFISNQRYCHYAGDARGAGKELEKPLKILQLPFYLLIAMPTCGDWNGRRPLTERSPSTSGIIQLHYGNKSVCWTQKIPIM